MMERLCRINFKDDVEFFEAIHAMGKSVNASEADDPEDKLVSLSAPFATVLLESHRLFDSVNLNIFGISPRADINIPYDFDGDSLVGLDYTLDGSYLLDENSGRMVSQRDLFVLPWSGCRGNLVFRGGKSSKTISFNGPKKILSDLLGENGRELWAEALETRRLHCGDGPRLLRAPQRVASAFLQILNCDYPNPIRRLFFESKFMEVLSRIVSREWPAEEREESGEAAFESERIRAIPGILMDRIDNPPSLSELARELSVNVTTMKKEFRNLFGEPIYAHHRNMCLDLAATLLLETDKAIFEIASEVGYSNSGNFGSAFKKRYGVSPSRYRRRGRNAWPLQGA